MLVLVPALLLLVVVLSLLLPPPRRLLAVVDWVAVGLLLLLQPLLMEAEQGMASRLSFQKDGRSFGSLLAQLDLDSTSSILTVRWSPM